MSGAPGIVARGAPPRENRVAPSTVRSGTMRSLEEDTSMKRATEMIQNARPAWPMRTLFKMDRPRTIDRYIDYFGAAASAARAEAIGGATWLGALARARAGGRHGSLAG